MKGRGKKKEERGGNVASDETVIGVRRVSSGGGENKVRRS